MTTTETNQPSIIPSGNDRNAEHTLHGSDVNDRGTERTDYSERSHNPHHVDKGGLKRLKDLFPDGLEDAGFGRPDFKRQPGDVDHIIRIEAFRKRDLPEQQKAHMTNAGLLQELGETYGITTPITTVHWSRIRLGLVPMALPASYVETEVIKDSS